MYKLDRSIANIQSRFIYTSLKIFIIQKMSTVRSQLKLQHTVLTEQDLALSFTKQSLWQSKLDHQNHHDQDAKEETQIPGLNPMCQTLSDVNSAYRSFAFDTFQGQITSIPDNPHQKIQELRQEGEESDHLSSSYERLLKQQIKLEQLEARNKEKDLRSFGSVSNEVNFSRDPKLRAIFDSSKSNLIRNQKNEEPELRSRLREIDYQIRELSVEKNRLKYFLRKQKNNIQDDISQSFQTRECPCCGKLISKLCFRCQHLYCNVDNCPRKKKQKLNAKMLEKMKEKKKGDRPRFKRSRDKQLRKKESYKKEDSEDMSFHSSDEDLLSENSLTLSSEQLEQLKTYETRNKDKQKVQWKMTMSDISLKESKLFVSDEDLLKI